MQNLENKSEIDLSTCKTTEELVNGVIRAIDSPNKFNSVVLRLDDTEINQSQMIFIKSLIESYGSKLDCVKTQNEATLSICTDVGIKTEQSVRPGTLGDYVIKHLAAEEEAKNNPKTLQNEPEGESVVDLSEVSIPGVQAVPSLDTLSDTTGLNSDITLGGVDLIQAETENKDLKDTKKQVITVYRKADEEEKAREFREEDVDFYATPTDEPIVVDSSSTIYIHQTLRSGQILDYDGNVVIIGDCHPGSEIKATGDITVWGVLGGIAHAGAKGNIEARIRALKMNAVQLRIADCYSRRPDQGNIPYIIKTSECTPEEARIVDDNIVLFKMAQD